MLLRYKYRIQLCLPHSQTGRRRMVPGSLNCSVGILVLKSGCIESLVEGEFCHTRAEMISYFLS